MSTRKLASLTLLTLFTFLWFAFVWLVVLPDDAEAGVAIHSNVPGHMKRHCDPVTGDMVYVHAVGIAVVEDSEHCQ